MPVDLPSGSYDVMNGGMKQPQAAGTLKHQS